jgi:HAD superfamily hydrolase (TIGR01549 family)
VLNDYPLKTVLWDFDGTMADTRERNLSVNRRIVEEVTEQPWDQVAALTSVEAYDAAWNRVSNWQELYTEAFGLDDEQLREAAQRWAPCQLDDHTEVPLFDGIGEVLDQLRDLPQAIVSQNDRAIIAHILAANQVDHYFTAIVGYAEVPLDRQKPAPDGLFRAIEILGVEEPGSALFIGDHETDTICAANANRDLTALGHELRFRSVAANFLVEDAGSRWTSSPDHQVNRPSELGKLITDLRVHLLNG